MECFNLKQRRGRTGLGLEKILGVQLQSRFVSGSSRTAKKVIMPELPTGACCH